MYAELQDLHAAILPMRPPACCQQEQDYLLYTQLTTQHVVVLQYSAPSIDG